MSTTYTLQADGTSQTVYPYEPYTIQLGAGLTQADLQWVWQPGDYPNGSRYVLELTEGRGEVLLPCPGFDRVVRPDSPQGLDRILTADGQDITATLRQALLNRVRQVDVAEGTSGNDLLYVQAHWPSFINRDYAAKGREGNDTLVAMPSTELYNWMKGGAGNDTYLINGDWGLAAITDAEGSNVVRFGAEWKPEDLTWLRQQDGSLVVTAALRQPIAGDVTYRNALLVSDFDATDPALRPQDLRFEFASQPGVVLTADEVRARLTEFTDADAEHLVNASVKPMTQGSPGKDNLTGADLRGGQGDDRLVVQPPNGQGIVHYALGDGNDTVLGYGPDVDVSVALDAGITPGMVRVQLGNVADGTLGDDQVRISFAGHLGGIAATDVPTLRFADGTVWSAQQVFQRALSTPVLVGAPLTGESFDLGALTTPLDIRGNTGDDTLTAGSGNDTIDGGTGRGNVINAGAGNDLVRARADTDVVSAGEGNDTIHAYGAGGLFDVRGQGNDTVVIHGASAPTVKLGKDGTDRIEYQATADAPGTVKLLLSDDIRRGSLVVDRQSGNFLKLIKATDGAVIAELDPALAYRVYFESDREPSVLLDQLPALLPASSGDLMQGTASDDSLVGSASLGTVILGLDGNDTLSASPVNAGSRGVTLDGGWGHDKLVGGNQADSLIGGIGNDTLLGGGGNDTLDGGQGDDSLDGGAGADLYRVNGTQYGDYAGGVSFYGFSGEDTIVADNTDTIEFSAPVSLDRLAISAAKGQIKLSLSGNSYPTNAFGITLDSSQDYSGLTLRDVNGDTFHGSDLIDRAVQNLRAVSNDVNTELTGFFGRDSIYGMGGNDTLHGMGGSDTLYGAGGNDLLLGDDGNDVLSSSDGMDTLVGGAGADVFEIYLNSGKSVIRADAQDTIKVNCLRSGLVIGRLDAAGSVQLTLTEPGMTSTQTLSVEQASTLVGLTLKFRDGSTMAWADVLTEAGLPPNITLVGSEDDDSLNPPTLLDTSNYLIQGLGGADYLQGAEGRDTLEGGAGSDTLRGRGGNDLLKGGADGEADYLDGGAGNDTLLGQDKGDTLIGGTGADRIVLADQYDANRLDIAYTVNADNNDTIELNEAYLKLPRGRLVQRSSGLDLELQSDTATQLGAIKFQNADRLTDTLLTNASGSRTFYARDLVDAIRGYGIVYEGTTGNDNLVSDAGSDVLLGLTGNDTLTGGDGNDFMSGDDGDDQLDGGAGNDTLAGSSGNDTLVGGAGADVYKIVLALGTDLIRADAQDTISLAYQRSGLSIGHLDAQGNVRLTLSDTFSRSTQTLIVEQASNLVGLTLKFSDDSTMAWSDVLTEALTFTGTSGNDTLIGSLANDTLTGGAGADLLNGVVGSDTYVLNLDSGGQDTVIAGAGDTLRFVTAADPATLRIEWVNADDLTVRRASDTTGANQVLITGGAGFLNGRTSGVLTVAQADGTSAALSSWAPYASHKTTYESLERDLKNNQLIGVGFAGQDDMSGVAPTGSMVYTVSLDGGAGNDTLRAGAGANNRLSGGDGNDVLYGGTASMNGLFGDAGDDVLYSNGNFDQLVGGAGADTYVIGAGQVGTTLLADAQDTVKLAFKRSDMSIQRQAADGSVTVNFGGTAAAPSASFKVLAPTGIDTFKLSFADGSTLAWKDVMVEATKPLPPANLTLTGTAKADTLKGGAGNDTLSGLAGNDSLSGAAGNDSLDGGAGADTLQGGTGNDTLVGGTGNDTYLFAKGDGQDRIVDTDSTLFNSDVLKVSGVATNQLWFKRTGNDLEVDLLGTQDKVFVQNWFKGSANQVEKITAADSGKSLTVTKVNALVSAMAAFSFDTSATSTLPSNTPAAITKLVASSWA